jgi:hypothetical protein
MVFYTLGLFQQELIVFRIIPGALGVAPGTS